jgi:hypothetical protein
MLIRSRHRPFSRGRTLIAGALFLSAGCGDSETGTFSGAASEKVAAEKGLAPGSKAQKAAVPPLAKGKTSTRPPGGGAATPD